MSLRSIAAATFTFLLVASCLVPAVAAPVCTKDGELSQRLNLPIYEWNDPDRIPKATIVAIHGLTFYAAAYDDLASYLTEKGYRFIAVDMRGFGRWRTENEKFNGDTLIHFTKSNEDALRVMQAVRQDQPDQKIYAMGESLGANIALDIVSKHPDSCDGVILGSLCYKPRVHPKPRWLLDFVKGVHHPYHKLDLTPYITPYLSHNRDLTKACLKDQRICRALSPADLIKASKTNNWALQNVENLPADYPVLVISGLLDGVFKTKSLPPLLDRFGSKEIDVNVFPHKGHLLLEHQKVMPEVATIFDRWLSKQTESEKVVQLP